MAQKTLHLKSLQELLKKGADVTKKNGGGMTPLHLAAYNGKCNIVKYLIQVCLYCYTVYVTRFLGIILSFTFYVVYVYVQLFRELSP